MRRRIRDLNFDEIVSRIGQFVDRKQRRSADPLIQSIVERARTPSNSVERLRNFVMSAALRHAKTVADIQVRNPAVEALVRVQHHPLAPAIPSVGVESGLKGESVAPRLEELVAAHPELVWDLDAVQALLIREILTYGDHELDDAQPPSNMHWAEASAAATALVVLVTLRELGDFDQKTDDPGQKAEYDAENEKFERTRNIAPSKLVK